MKMSSVIQCRRRESNIHLIVFEMCHLLRNILSTFTVETTSSPLFTCKTFMQIFLLSWHVKGGTLHFMCQRLCSLWAFQWPLLLKTSYLKTGSHASKSVLLHCLYAHLCVHWKNYWWQELFLFIYLNQVDIMQNYSFLSCFVFPRDTFHKSDLRALLTCKSELACHKFGVTVTCTDRRDSNTKSLSLEDLIWLTKMAQI